MFTHGPFSFFFSFTFSEPWYELAIYRSIGYSCLPVVFVVMSVEILFNKCYSCTLAGKKHPAQVCPCT